MQEQATPRKPGAAYVPTQTPGVYKRAQRYVAKWREAGKIRWRSFPTYEAACAFRRDFVLPYRELGGLPPSSIAPEKRGTGWVYVFQSRGPGEPVKIGWSSDPARRLRDLSGAHPYRLDLMLLVPGSRVSEARTHSLVADFRLEGEWFSREALGMLSARFWGSPEGTMSVASPGKSAPRNGAPTSF